LGSRKTLGQLGEASEGGMGIGRKGGREGGRTYLPDGIRIADGEPLQVRRELGSKALELAEGRTDLDLREGGGGREGGMVSGARDEGREGGREGGGTYLVGRGVEEDGEEGLRGAGVGDDLE